jgi:polyisoprenoid-binding protein YceI
VALCAGPCNASAVPAWRIARGEVRVLCPLTVGGSFEARTSSVAGTLGVGAASPLTLTGDVTVDLTTLDSGIAMRNDHMRHNYLETGKGPGYDTAVLSGIRFPAGDLATLTGRTHFDGTLSLHGTKRAVAGEADVHREGSAVRVDAAFPVRLEDYAIAPPRYLGVGVKEEVQVKVTLTAAPALATEGAR